MAVNYINEPAGAALIYQCSLNNIICPGMTDVYNSSVYQTLTLPEGGSGKALDSAMVAGSNTGNGWWIMTLASVPELYFGCHWQTNADFMGYVNNTNKMLFAFREGMDNNFLVWQGLPGQPKTLKWYNQATYANTGHPGEVGMNYPTDGTGWFEPNTGSNATVAAASGWHFIEVYLKCSTSKTSRDGIIRWFLNGNMIGNYPTVNLSPGGLTQFQINQAWDGTPSGRDLSKSWHHYWANLKVSTGGTGSGGSGGGGGGGGGGTPQTLVEPTNLYPRNITLPFGPTTSSWNAVPGAANYAVRIHEVGAPYEPASSLLAYETQAGTTITRTTAPSKQYDWWVHGVDGSGTLGPSAGGLLTTSDSTVPPPPDPDPIPDPPPDPPVDPPPVEPPPVVVPPPPAPGEPPVLPPDPVPPPQILGTATVIVTVKDRQNPIKKEFNFYG